jgi:hypothetical protein
MIRHRTPDSHLHARRRYRYRTHEYTHTAIAGVRCLITSISHKELRRRGWRETKLEQRRKGDPAVGWLTVTNGILPAAGTNVVAHDYDVGHLQRFYRIKSP